MNSFAFIIKRHLTGPENDGKGITQYLRNVFPDAREQYQWANSPLNSTLMSADMRDVILTKLREKQPIATYSYEELFTQ